MADVETDTVEGPVGEAALSGVEPWRAGPERAAIGVLLCHGFTGSPQSMRPWGEYLAERHPEYAIELPLLPGHGRPWRELQATRWTDWYARLDEAFAELKARCDQVFLMGLSMGGGLALRLAEEHAADVAGLVLVNPSVTRNKPAEALLPLLSKVIPSIPAIASDIKKPGMKETGTDRTPLKAAHSLSRFWTVVTADLPKVTAPLLVLHSAEDHVVHPRNSALVLGKVSSTDKREVVLRESFHVATLDHDAERIFADSAEFVARIGATERAS
ncbi:alpha/beta fold hydrolase [Actinospica sp. MGRD01-02]|uniref:Alpha/beta fold hydrolase n=1 Tax=Actinospica acidithermotolerans TaxID=2828514 RepID=A0A941IFM5_9ACTN|nr:alpha/beta fold hydrolase [Actinospica acidithermotolerans]MBR7826500.1 alpha/beta fold hydrolase [Actinospica acidithermotolerans]